MGATRHPVLLTFAPQAGRHLHGARHGCGVPERPRAESQQRADVDITQRSPRTVPAQITEFIRPEISEPRHTALIEKRCDERPLGSFGHSARGLGGVPVVAQGVGAEVSDDVGFVAGA